MTAFASDDAQVFGTTMRYQEAGSGRPVVFLHGNPTSAYCGAMFYRRLPPAVTGLSPST